MFRVVQATAPRRRASSRRFAAYAAHATAGGGDGLHGDWPQFLSEEMTRALRRRRPRDGRRARRHPAVPPGLRAHLAGEPRLRRARPPHRLHANYMAHVRTRVEHRHEPVSGPVAAAQRYIREPITGPGGPRALHRRPPHRHAPAALAREPVGRRQHRSAPSRSAIRVGGVLFSGTPGEGFPAIGAGIRDAVEGEQEVIQLGLANDQLGYLIAPARVRAGDRRRGAGERQHHLQRLADDRRPRDVRRHRARARDRVRRRAPPECAPYDAQDVAGDPVANVPVGGVVAP